MSSILLRSIVPSSATRRGSAAARWCAGARAAASSPPATTSDSPRPPTRAMTASRETAPRRAASSSASRAEAEPLVDLLVRRRRTAAARAAGASIGAQRRLAAAQRVDRGPRGSRRSPGRRRRRRGCWPAPRAGAGVSASASRAATRPPCISSAKSSSCARRAELVRPGAQHREDRALARLLQGRVGGLGALPGRGRELRAGRRAGEPLHRRGQAVQELREDRPGVAARAVESAVGGDAGRVADAVGERGRRAAPPPPCSVAARLAPVSASRTGKTLMRFSVSCSRTTASAPARSTREKPVPSSVVRCRSRVLPHVTCLRHRAALGRRADIALAADLLACADLPPGSPEAGPAAVTSYPAARRSS